MAIVVLYYLTYIMDAERHWFMIKRRIDLHGRVTIVIPGNLPPHEIQYIRDTIESARYAQGNHELVDLDGLVPDINYITTPLIPNDVEAEERPNLFVQRPHTNPTNLNTSVPDVVHNAVPLILGGVALEEEPDLSTQEPEFRTDLDMLDAFVPNVDHNEASLVLSDVIIIEESDLHH
jgi:hypothetical protein